MKARKTIVFVFTLFLLGSSSHISVVAHTSLISQSPKGNSLVQELPSKISLTFDENLIVIGQANSITVTDPNGTEVSTGETSVADNVVSRLLTPSILSGKFTVSYRVVSEDGHVVSNSYQFTVGNSTAELASPKSNEEVEGQNESSISESATEIPEAVANKNAESHQGHTFLGEHSGHLLMIIGALVLIYIWKRQSK
jgi:methionine-rich copper-binding protein CopC